MYDEIKAKLSDHFDEDEIVMIQIIAKIMKLKPPESQIVGGCYLLRNMTKDVAAEANIIVNRGGELALNEDGSIRMDLLQKMCEGLMNVAHDKSNRT
jgi:hypothetical protein